MCPVCGRYLCTPVCPRYLGQSPYKGKSREECGGCGMMIYTADKYVRKSGILLCERCAELPVDDGRRSFDIWSV